MNVKIYRDAELYGTISCSVSPNMWGQLDSEVWFCPHCGRIYAKEVIEFEEGEQHYPVIYRVLVRPCHLPLHDLALPHPTFWAAADTRMLTSALQEHFFGHTTLKCPSLPATG